MVHSLKNVLHLGKWVTLTKMRQSNLPLSVKIQYLQLRKFQINLKKKERKQDKHSQSSNIMRLDLFHFKRHLIFTVADPYLELGRGPGFVLVSLLAFLPSFISSFSSKIRGERKKCMSKFNKPPFHGAGLNVKNRNKLVGRW